MNPLRELPLLVVAAFPPNPTTNAVIIALLPPAKRKDQKTSSTHSEQIETPTLYAILKQKDGFLDCKSNIY